MSSVTKCIAYNTIELPLN